MYLNQIRNWKVTQINDKKEVKYEIELLEGSLVVVGVGVGYEVEGLVFK